MQKTFYEQKFKNTKELHCFIIKSQESFGSMIRHEKSSWPLEFETDQYIWQGLSGDFISDLNCATKLSYPCGAMLPSLSCAESQVRFHPAGRMQKKNKSNDKLTNLKFDGAYKTQKLNTLTSMARRKWWPEYFFPH